MGKKGLIKDWAFLGGRPAHLLVLPTGLGSSWAQPILPQWPSQINLFWVWVWVIAVPLPALLKPVSPSLSPCTLPCSAHSGACLPPRTCLVGGERLRWPQPLTSQLMRP